MNQKKASQHRVPQTRLDALAGPFPHPMLSSVRCSARSWVRTLSSSRHFGINRAPAATVRARHSRSGALPPTRLMKPDEESELPQPATVVYMGAQKCYITLSDQPFQPMLARVCSKLLAAKGEDRLVVGDFVRAKVGYMPTLDEYYTTTRIPEDYYVTEKLPRKTSFCRADPMGKAPKVLAANIDLLVVVSSFGIPRFSSLVIDRVLAAAGAADIPAALVMNKLDLDSEGLFRTVAETYRGAGYTVVGTSLQGEEPVGLDAFRELVKVRCNSQETAELW